MCDTDAHRAAGRSSHGIANLPDGISGPCADIEGLHARLIGKVESADVSLGNIQHMNIVAHARTVWSVVIIAVNREELALTASGLQQERNDMSFWIVPFSGDIGRARSIEVTHGYDTPAIGRGVPVQRALQH